MMFGKDTIVTALKLFVITAVAALCLAVVDGVTKPIIAENSFAAEQEALRKVLSGAEKFDEYKGEAVVADSSATIEKINIGKKDSEVMGYVVNVVSSEGYGGDIKVMVGIGKDMAVERIEILESSETAGLGANASKPKFADQFKGAKDTLTVVKGAAKEGEISAISSATITSKAVTSCVNSAVAAAKAVQSADADIADIQPTEKTEEGGAKE